MVDARLTGADIETAMRARPTVNAYASGSCSLAAVDEAIALLIAEARAEGARAIVLDLREIHPLGVDLGDP